MCLTQLLLLFFFHRSGNSEKLWYLEEVNRFPFSNIYIDSRFYYANITVGFKIFRVECIQSKYVLVMSNQL